ncbi:MAG: NAD(P)/FAD-dependent oxidoreductase [Candidatus Bathyarchaeia archaeon]
MKYDIGIVGAGMAGLSTALYICSRTDATVLMVDKKKIGDPTKSSPFTFPDIVENYNLQGAVIQGYTKFTFRSPQGVSSSFEFDKPAFVTFDYEKACDILLRRIKKEGNVEIYESISVLSFELGKPSNNKGNRILMLEDGTKSSVDVLVDSSGSAFLGAETLGQQLPPLYSHAYGEVLRGCSVEDPSEMHILSGRKYGNGGGWFYPMDTQTARYGFATVTRSRHYPKKIVKANFGRACKDFSPYSEMVQDAETLRPEFGTIPIGPLKNFVFDRLLIVGDAAGQATPWYCEGIRPALEGGKICGKVIARAYEQRDYSRKVLGEYQREWDALNRYRYSMAMRRSTFQWFRRQEFWDSGVKKTALFEPSELISTIRYGERSGIARPAFFPLLIRDFSYNIRCLILQAIFGTTSA